MKKSSIFLIILSLSFFSFTSKLSKILPVIKQVESNGITTTIGDNGKAFGILQIHKICVDDVNRIYGTSYVHEDAFDEVCSEEIFNLYIDAGIKRFKTKYKKEPTEQDIVRMWNGSIYNGYKKQATVKYYKRYLKFKSNAETLRIQDSLKQNTLDGRCDSNFIINGDIRISSHK